MGTGLFLSAVKYFTNIVGTAWALNAGLVRLQEDNIKTVLKKSVGRARAGLA